MHDALLLYFGGEKHAGLLAAAAGIAAIGVAAILLAPRHELRAFATTLGIIGLLEVGIGVGLYLKTGPQIDRLAAQLAADPPRLLREEGARMEKVQRNFVVLESLWIALLGGGAVAAVAWKQRPTAGGIALALVVQAGFFLAFDVVAERRGAVYLARLKAG